MLRLIRRAYAVGQKPLKVENQFYDVFNSIGKLSTEYKIRMTKLNCPVIGVPRTVLQTQMPTSGTNTWV